MVKANRATWLDELARQRERLKRDLPARLTGVATTFAVFSFFLPFWFLFFVLLVIICTEVMTHRLLTAADEGPMPARPFPVLASAATGMFFYVLPALFIWLNADPLVKLIGVLSIVGALLSVSVVRSIHLPFGIASGIPPALALLWLPTQYLFDPGSKLPAAAALIGVAALLAYFFSALVQSNGAQTRLVAAIDEAVAASQAKSTFLTTMSHEVRTPLNAISGHAELLLQTDLLPGPLAHARGAARATRLLKTMIEDVSDLAAAVEGELRFHPITAIIRDEVEAIGHIASDALDENPPEFSVTATSEVPEFGRFDPILLRKCLVHLRTIILEDQPEEGARRVYVRCAMAPGRRDRLRISLSGSDPGQRNDGQDPIGETGTLAHSLTRRLAEVMGGKTTVIRAPDGSLSARLELPFVAVADPPSTGAESVYGRLRVLVVDDVPTNRFVVVQLLRALRIEAKEATSGQHAIERLSEAEFDLVLLDMNMPDMDGEATFREIRGADAEWRNIPVIALTADAIAERRNYYLSLGLNGFVSKPVDRRLLWAEILDVLPPPPPL